ncbi:MAG: IclR family transcriptional regulator [Kiritimatiellae bacterium]|nr:IclR family transcriptional regulator [Kiritimatiellia bacterium]
MIKVLYKVFDILELLAETPERPWALKEIAVHLGQHPATCANILKTMVCRHYVEQVAPKKGYLLGPALFQISRQAPYRQDLIAAAEPLMADLAKSVNETVLLTTLRLGRRFILAQINGQQQIQVGPQALIQDNIYETATGRLLMAFLLEHELEQIAQEHGMPGKEWPEAGNPAALKQALADIRKTGWVYHAPNAEVVGLAFPIHDHRQEVTAALGLFLPRFRFKGAHKAAILKRMSTTATAISKRLSVNGNNETPGKILRRNVCGAPGA